MISGVLWIRIQVWIGSEIFGKALQTETDYCISCRIRIRFRINKQSEKSDQDPKKSFLIHNTGCYRHRWDEKRHYRRTNDSELNKNK
jgi:hypothetical protein